MNLEEELATLESQSTIMQQPINNVMNENNLSENQMNSFNGFNNIEVDNNMLQNQYQMTNQPAVVDLNRATQQVASFNIANLEFDINKPQQEGNVLPRLAGQNGESFRIHILPVPPSRLHTHWDGKRNKNFVCLKDAYGTNYERCCETHGNAKPRNIIPILVYPTVQGNLNTLIPNVSPELKVLIINDKKLNEIRQAASSVLGIDISQVNLDSVDIIARVDNPQYKSHIFNCTPTSMKEQVKAYIPSLIEKWKQLSTPENICKSAATLITREVYESTYSDYNYRDYLNNTPTQGSVPTSFTFNGPVSQTGYPQSYGGAFPPGQPFYNGSSSTTTFGGQF